MAGPLGREQLLKLFEELSTELGRRGAQAHVYLFGGAAMSVAFDRDRRTVDLDVRVDSGREKLAREGSRLDSCSRIAAVHRSRLETIHR